MVVGGLHDLIPQITGAHLAVDPQAVFALEGAFGQDVFVRLGNVHQLNRFIRFNSLHERVGDTDGEALDDADGLHPLVSVIVTVTVDVVVKDAETVGVDDAVSVAVTVAVGLTVLVSVAVWVADRDEDGVKLLLAVRVAERVADGVCVGLAVGDRDTTK